MTHIFTDSQHNSLEVREINSKTFNVMLDNLGRPGLTPDQHMFAAMDVPKDDARLFVAKIAQAMGFELAISEKVPPVDSVSVEDNANDTMGWDRSTPRYVVSGDITDGVNQYELDAAFEKWQTIGAGGFWSMNYFVQSILQSIEPYANAFEYDSESSCFFAYTNSKIDADNLAAWINEKKFLV